MLNLNCPNCDHSNPHVARICRYCGQALRPGDEAPRPTDYAAPQGSYVPSHDWASSAPLPAPPAYATPQAQPSLSAENFRCPYCQTTQPPVVATRISTGGWIVFAALIIACLPLCFIGLLIKEQYTMCSWCRAPLP
ncbi:MAG: LITAF-like zinc ribbon domain-containing protein [Acidobacteriota bacterium]|nr:LITAF-like zinc ribbon domain-containing protein [Acidobacteriota bacterium]